MALDPDPTKRQQMDVLTLRLLCTDRSLPTRGLQKRTPADVVVQNFIAKLFYSSPACPAHSELSVQSTFV